MKLPRNVIINNMPFMLTKNNKYAGACFDYEKNQIIIGTWNLSDREIFANFLHEIVEISMIERRMRMSFCKPETDETQYFFSGDHKQLQDVVTDVARVLTDSFKME